ncbi:HepT-like ribonuclease domain-containing protein [Geoalkalibacter subterraneus]|uniref:DUF86 domain-containing protein n=1 Tax=Geoalkalibacter subterraneus TaxID=483547 RepID=A0A0B5FSM4_9BACT|nr:DUF86 domain-containing protein [Geoalkalibacter subterraneus]AJF07654.1 hypothetical protein GSUB_15400 [Geoalkalibacter subterraneus]
MSKRTESLYLRDMKEAAEAILSYTQGVTYDAFKNDRMRHSAVIREFQIIGEAVGKLGDSIKKAYPHIAWQDIKDFRNLLIHEYFGVDLEIVWNVVQEDLPTLYEAIQAIEKNL